MCALKKIVPLMLVSVVVCHWNHFAFAVQNIDLAKVQDNRKKLIETSSCLGCELAGVNLSGVNLDRVNLTGANLAGAQLSQARLHLATLNKANLQNADLRDVEFGGADLAEADLRGADLRGATFVGAYLVGIQLDKEVALNQPSEEPVLENISNQAVVEKSLSDSKSLGATSVVEKKEDKTPVATSQQPPIEDKGKQAASPSAEPSFFDRTLGSVKGLFGQGDSVEKKVVVEKSAAIGKTAEVTPEVTPAVQAVPRQDVVAASPPVKEQQPVEVKGKQVSPPSAEPGFFDKTLGSVKGLFGQGESDNKAVTGKHNGDHQEGKLPEGNEVIGSQVIVNKIDPAVEIVKNKVLLLETKHCYGCNLMGVDLTGKNMDSADLEGADLSGSMLEGVDFENANLKGALLVKANLKNADLRKADLYKANLSGADLTGAKLDGAFLDDAQLSDAVGYELQGR